MVIRPRTPIEETEPEVLLRPRRRLVHRVAPLVGASGGPARRRTEPAHDEDGIGGGRREPKRRRLAGGEAIQKRKDVEGGESGGHWCLEVEECESEGAVSLFKLQTKSKMYVWGFGIGVGF